MMMEDEFQDRNNNLSLDDIDLSLLRLSSPPCDYSRSSFFSAVSPEISPLKRSSPVSDESDQPKRRKISLQNPTFITSPLRFTYPETQSSSIDDQTRYPNLTAGQVRCSHASPVSEKHETSPSASKTPETETMKVVNNRVEEINREETTNSDAYENQQKEEEDCEEGMRIERSGDGFVIRLKCRCKQAFRVLFSDHHLYFKPL
ncbi:uncharacterized protein LOC18027019 [Eutrema salsugineum]|nr:uncharacterized protein LOC18027019 [Eutrema salsugineum]